MSDNLEAILDELSRYDQDFDPTPMRRPGLECLDNGMHDLLVVSAELGETQQARQPIVRMNLRVVSPHQKDTEVEHGYLLTSQVGVNILGADLLLLGIDAPEGLPFSAALPAMLRAAKGKRFRARKDVGPDREGKVRQRLYIASALKGPGTSPAPLGQAAGASNGPRPVIPAQPPPRPAPRRRSVDEDIPF